MATAGGIPAVVTAGGRLPPSWADEVGTDIKALAPVAGRPLAAVVLDALADTPGVGPVALVGPDEVRGAAAHRAGPGLLLVPEGDSGPDNMLRGLQAVADAAGDGYALLCTSDLPFVSAGAVARLLALAPPDADIAYPVVTRGEYEAVFPGSPNAWTPVAGELLTGGSILLVRPAALQRSRAHVERVFAARKSQWAMARLLGLPFALRFLLRRLSVADVEARASAILQCRCVALRHAPPEVCCDVDTLDEYRWACGRVAAGSPAAEDGGGALLSAPGKAAA